MRIADNWGVLTFKKWRQTQRLHVFGSSARSRLSKIHSFCSALQSEVDSELDGWRGPTVTMDEKWQQFLLIAITPPSLTAVCQSDSDFETHTE